MKSFEVDFFLLNLLFVAQSTRTDIDSYGFCSTLAIVEISIITSKIPVRKAQRFLLFTWLSFLLFNGAVRI